MLTAQSQRGAHSDNTPVSESDDQYKVTLRFSFQVRYISEEIADSDLRDSLLREVGFPQC